MTSGFTGTQRGMTAAQAAVVRLLFSKLGVTELHHGDCIGADRHAHLIACEMGIRVIIHPPSNDSKRAFCKGDETRPERDYLTRNRDIVIESDVIIATPKEEKEVLRSGTWSTIRRARKRGKPTVIVSPSGKLSWGDETRKISRT